MERVAYVDISSRTWRSSSTSAVVFLPTESVERAEGDLKFILLKQFLFEVLDRGFFEIEGWPGQILFILRYETSISHSRRHERPAN